MLETELLVGAIGWDNNAWQDGFYPPDLPQDWRLGYYSNRLRAVLVPFSVWRDDQTNPEEWMDDIYPEFRLVLAWEMDEHDPIGKTRDFINRIQPIAGNVDAYLVSLPGPVSDQMVQAIKLLSAHRPVSMIGKNFQMLSDEIRLHDVAGTSECWLTGEQEKPISKGDFLVALTSESNGKRVRDIVDEINHWPDTIENAKGAALFFTGDSGADNAVQARTIVELMGV